MPDLLLGIYAYLKKYVTRRRTSETKKLWVANKNLKTLTIRNDGFSKREAGYLSNSNESIDNETIGPYSDNKKFTCKDECMTDKCSSITKRNCETEKEEMEKEMVQMINSLCESVNQIRKELNSIAKEVDVMKEQHNKTY